MGVVDGNRESMIMLARKNQRFHESSNGRFNAPGPVYLYQKYQNHNQSYKPRHNQNYKPSAPPDTVCDTCGYKGHYTMDYYRTVGYSPDF